MIDVHLIISTITLNVNGLNTTIERDCQKGYKVRLNYTLSKRGVLKVKKKQAKSKQME